ncbi:c-type cytochrome [Phaeovulum sp.]|uniref:c-type cytochrome n=1 Tax=Phaeovulum sp. TaxID=2934796 RepID=UPI0039E2A2BF
MFNTMNLTKAVGAILGATLFLLLGNWVASSLYSIGTTEHGEVIAEAPAADSAETQVADAEEEPAAEEPAAEETVAEETAADTAAADTTADAGDAVVAAAGDAELGAKVFGKCKACHKIDGKNATGPHLNGVVGRPIASVEDFKYSDAMSGHGGDWTPEVLDAYLTKPKDYIPGNKMSFAGLKKPEDRANLIAYLESLDG